MYGLNVMYVWSKCYGRMYGLNVMESKCYVVLCMV